ncbi:hypothetical protein DRQ11_08810 [candidate division KSB1 bacterium]|nr:MAG: hypothetical protein DRQ11_08810 [candidate division KSB1 bacterium]
MSSINNLLSKFRQHFSRGDEKKSDKGQNLLPKIILGVIFVGVTVLFFPHSASYRFANLSEGSVSDQEIIAPFTFYIMKGENELKRDREKAIQQVLPVFIRDDSVAAQALKKFDQIITDILTIRIVKEPDTRKLMELRQIAKENNIILSDKNLEFFLRSNIVSRHSARSKSSKIDLERYFQILRGILEDIYTVGILDIDKKDIPFSHQQILVQENGKFVEQKAKYLYDLEEAKTQIVEKLRAHFQEVGDSVKVGYALLIPMLKSNIIYDSNETQRRIRAAIAQVPIVKGTILKGERIIDSHQRVTKEHVEILHSLAKALEEREASGGWLKLLLNYLGRIAIVIIALLPLTIFLLRQRPTIFWDDRLLIMITTTMLFLLFLTFIVLHYGLSKFVVPVVVLPMVLTIYFDSRVGFVSAISLILLIGILCGNDLDIVIVSVFATTMALTSLSFFRHRKRLANSVLFIGGGYLFSICTLGLLRQIPLTELLQHCGNGVINGILTPIITYGFIMFFDSIFDVTSEFKLLELSDMNSPLLKMLAVRAPGTYHHSLLVSNLSEAAAEAIGANALLAKVGAYYHDIGKIFMPEYFVENQQTGKNPHDKLSPWVSSLILVNHVRKGIELAEEHKLPTAIKAFIMEHHGQSLMKYFYDKALRQKNSKSINEADFHYPGRRPTTKETGIVMLADSVEAFSRSIKEPNVGKIRNAVRGIIDERIRSGELDDCPLTVKELTIIAESFNKILLGVYHARIEYPVQQEPIEPKVTTKKSKVSLVES